MFKSIRKAIQTVNEVKQWGEDTTAYEDEQRVKRGDVAPEFVDEVERFGGSKELVDRLRDKSEGDNPDA